MKINNQLPIIYEPYQRSVAPVENGVSHAPSQPQTEPASQRPPPVAWAEHIERARDYTLKTQTTHESFDQRGKEAIIAYDSHDKSREREYLSNMLGLDTFA